MEFYPPLYNLTTIIVVAYSWTKGTFQFYARSMNKHYHYGPEAEFKLSLILEISNLI
jgi:hypothetical protein